MTDTNDALKALTDIIAVTCDPEGIVCIRDSQGDKDILQKSIETIRAALTQPQLKTTQNCSYEPKADVDLDSIKWEISDSTDIGYKAVSYVIDHLAAQGYLAPQVPVGWQLVPIQPTDEMWEAGYSAGDGETCAREIYKAMLKAAPKKEG